MKQMTKAAVFLMLLGKEKGQRVLSLMDNDEIRAIIPEIRAVTAISAEVQETVWREFIELGYNEESKAFEIVDIIRFSFGGGKIKK